MTDRELLERAARAAGMSDIECGSFGFYRVIGIYDDDKNCMVEWNPLTNDGDALRLSVKLGMLASFEPPLEVGAVCRIVADWDAGTGYPRVSATEQHNSDPYAATRRAIVRAAAEIGMAAE